MQFPLNHFIPYSSITSSEVASHDVTFDLVIDKLSFRLKEHFLIDDLIYHFDNNQIIFEVFNQKHETGIRSENFIFFYNYKTKIIYKIITNPNYYSNFHEYRKKFKFILPKNIRNILIINQIDFAINFFNLPFNILLKVLIIKFKQSFDRMKSNRNDKRTHYYGAPPRQSKAYDKKFKIAKSKNRKFQELKLLNIQELIKKSEKYKHWSELEVSLSGENIPTKNVKYLLRAIHSKDFNPFKNHQLANYGIKDQREIHPKLIEKYYQIREAINCLGFFEAKKILNTSGNFNRSFDKIVESGKPLNLEDYFQPLLKEYLQKGRIKKVPELNLANYKYTLSTKLPNKNTIYQLPTWRYNHVR